MSCIKGSSSSSSSRRLRLIRASSASLVIFSLIGCLMVDPTGAVPTPTTTQESDKDRGVRHVNVEVINSTSITLKWSMPSRSPGSCQPQRYMIRLKQAGIRQSRAWRLEGERHTVSLHDLQPGTEYQVRLMTITCDGQKKHSRWVKVTTLPEESVVPQQEETQAPGQPTSVRTRTFVDSAVVTWSAPEDNTLVRTYMIGYGEGVPDVKWIYVNGSQRNVTILNLKPSTQYVISVRAINNFGKGLVVYDLVYTRESAPARLSAGGSLPAPSQLSSKILTPTSVLLQWNDPSLDSQQRINDERYYNVYYQAAPSGKNLSVIVKALHVTLPDLLPNRQYRFKVRTVKGSHTSPFSESITNWTRMDGLPVGETVVPTGGTAPTPLPQPTQRFGSSVLVDDYEDYTDQADADDGNIDVLLQSSREQGKTKRAHHSRPPIGSPPQPSMARTLIDLVPPVNRNSTSATSDAATIQIQFRSLVQYRISAYVTWPDKPASCSAEATPTTTSTVAGYIFRYRALEDDNGHTGGGSSSEYVVRNLAANFVLLDNLMPRVRYSYQVRYVFDRGEPSAWSQEALLDTTYNNAART